MSIRNRIVIIALISLWLGWPHQSAQARASHVCSDACGNGASCDSECWLTQFDFDQGNPSTTCGAQDYSCCGDGWCDYAEGCNVCPEDCGYQNYCPPPPIGCGPDNPCPPGESCNGAHECVTPPPEQTPPSKPACGGTCTSTSQCCGNDVCQGLEGGPKVCAIPETDYCPDAPACSGMDEYGVEWTNCDFTKFCGGSLPLDAYCDPGIDRCQFIEGPVCPDINYATLNVCIY